MVRAREKMKSNNESPDQWIESDWYKEWVKLAHVTEHTNRQSGYWTCYVDDFKNVNYVYVYS
jgi:hypothetical protein